jgi:predicted RNA binding protein YcfA (HicA-like mRNA interferase family)
LRLVPSSIPSVSGAKVVRALESAGFAVTRINGSHHMMRHPDGRSVAVPVHSGRDIAKGTLRGILASIGINPDEFRKLL